MKSSSLVALCFSSSLKKMEFFGSAKIPGWNSIWGVVFKTDYYRIFLAFQAWNWSLSVYQSRNVSIFVSNSFRRDCVLRGHTLLYIEFVFFNLKDCQIVFSFATLSEEFRWTFLTQNGIFLIYIKEWCLIFYIIKYNMGLTV